MDRLLLPIRDILKNFFPDKIVDRFISAEFVTFLIIGCINTFSTTVISSILDSLKGALLSGTLEAAFDRFRITFIIGYCASLVISFFLNTKFTFREKPTLKKFIKFPLSYVPNFAIQYILVWFFTAIDWNKTIAYMLAAVISLPITFIVMRLFVYNKK